MDMRNEENTLIVWRRQLQKCHSKQRCEVSSLKWLHLWTNLWHC